VIARAQVFSCFLLTLATLCSRTTAAQPAPEQTPHVTTVHGRVLNSVTREPIAHSLVISQSDNAATFTDDRGQFELAVRNELSELSGLTPGMRAASLARFIEARKPGYLREHQRATASYTSGLNNQSQSEVTIRLTPEALIVGHVDVSGLDGEVRIQCQLFRRDMREGREYWSADKTFTTWADGEFRFSELAAGTYKLITHEQMDRESALGVPGAPLVGYPPVYYPNTTDFSVASPIVVKAGETARVNLAVARRQYYPVKIGVENAPSGQGVNVQVYPSAHHSPGWSLGYNPGDGTIEGMLPDGTYTLEATSFGQNQTTGILNFSVRGRALEGPSLSLIPNATIVVRVHEEFQSQASNLFTVEPNQENPQMAGKRFSRVEVHLVSLDELQPIGRDVFSQQPPEGLQGEELTIPNVPPGRYVVNVIAGSGYAASIQSGGRDLTHQPLVVGLGGEVAPIDVVLKDDGAEITVSLEETGRTDNEAAQNGVAYLFPLGDNHGRVQISPSPMWQGQFTFQNLPPGKYLLVGLESPRDDLLHATEESIQALTSKGQIVQVEAGQKLNAKLKVMPSEED
jgi:hypothetical protein